MAFLCEYCFGKEGKWKTSLCKREKIASILCCSQHPLSLPFFWRNLDIHENQSDHLVLLLAASNRQRKMLPPIAWKKKQRNKCTTYSRRSTKTGTQPPTVVCKMEAQLEYIQYVHTAYPFLHVWCQYVCSLSQCLLKNFLHSSSVGSLIRAHCWLGRQHKEFDTTNLVNLVESNSVFRNLS